MTQARPRSGESAPIVRTDRTHSYDPAHRDRADGDRGDRDRSLRIILDTGDPWAIIAPSGTVRAASAHLHANGGVVGRPIMALVGDADRETVSRALDAAVADHEPVRIPLDEPHMLGASGGGPAELMVTQSPIDLDDMVVQVVAAPPDDTSHAAGDKTREAELVAALVRIRSLALKIVEAPNQADQPAPTIAQPLPATLTERRLEVATEILRGKSVNAVAAELGLSPHTVRNHLKAVYRQVGVNSRAELLRRFHP